MEQKVINICICDDNKVLVTIIDSYLQEFKNHPDLDNTKIEISHYLTGEALLNSDIEYDVVILDLNLGAGKNGFEVASKMNDEYEVRPVIIFLTNDKEFGENTYKVRAHWFFTKPVEKEEFQKVVLNALKELANSNGVMVMVNGLSKVVYFDDIRYIQKYGNETYVHLVNSSFSVYTSLSQWLDILNKTQFVQPHKSFIINLEYLTGVSDNKKEIEMRHKEVGELVKLAKGKLKHIETSQLHYWKLKARKRL